MPAKDKLAGVPLRVLMLEDDADDAELVLRALRKGGFDVTHERAWDGKRFGQLLDRGPWDLIVSDFQMGGFTGLDALDIYGARGIDIPFIIISGTIGEDIAVGCIKAGASDYLMKDNLLRLVSAVKRELEQSGTRRRLLDSEKQIQQAQRMEAIGRLAGGVAHDFNNLLAVILMYCDLFLKRLPKDSGDYADMEQIKKASENGAALTRQLLAFSRRQVLEPRVVDPNHLLRGLHVLLGRLIGEDIKVEMDLEDELLRVRIDPGQLEQVIINLVVNARDALPKGGTIRVRTSNCTTEKGPTVRLSVEDDGVGMSRETQAQIFEPFFTTKGPRKGTGLGLATAFGIVRQSGGYFEVESAPGEGSCFHIYLPALDLPPEPGLPDQLPVVHHKAPARPRTVMVIDDEPDLRDVICSSLLGEGFIVAPAATIAEAIAYAKSEQPLDLLVTDMVMPDVKGPELAAKVLEARPGVKVVMMSGYLDDALERLEVDRAKVNFLNKPFSSQEFFRMIRMVLDDGT